ncbi:MAG: phosphatase PAP2 family protein [Nitrospirae bacterium]|nr:MAG: phosphatase PAP2 family protein [Nitrospirota bacterium]
MESLRLIDTHLFNLLNRGISNPVLDRVMPFVTDHVPLLFIPVLLYLLLKNRRLFLITLIVSLVALSISDGLSNTLKHLFQRPRPFQAIRDAVVLVGKGGSYSLPSSHSANAFSVALVLCYFLRQTERGLLRTSLIGYSLLVALVVAFSRVYVGVHYPFDVLSGGVLGVAAGWFAIWGYTVFSGLLKNKRGYALLLFMLFGLSLFRLYYIQTGPLDLSPDEAHYWDWSRNLDLSYYSKGPAIAYIIKASTLIFGNTLLGVRLPAVLFILFSSLTIYALTLSVSDCFQGFESYEKRQKAGLFSALLFNIIPLFAAFGVINTIDSPLILVWSLALYLFWWLVRDWPIRRKGLKGWLLLGFVTGVGILVKYSMVFFIGSAFLFMIFNKDKRGLLLSPGPWIGLLVCLVVASPIVIWNAQHGWVSFLHTAGQAHISDGLTLKPGRFFEFLGSQLGVVGPVVFVFMIAGLLWCLKQKSDQGFLFWFFAPTFMFFLLKSLQGKVQANWALPCYISSVIATAIYVFSRWQQWKGSVRLTLIGGVILSLFITVIAHYPSIINLPPKMDPSARLRGWSPLAGEIDKIAKDLRRPYFIFSDRYQITSELAFYLKGQPRTYCVNLGRRMNQYDLWPGFYDFKGQDALFVRWGKKALPRRIASSFDECERRLFTVRERGYVLRDYSIFICRNFHGMKKETPERF